MNSLRTLRTDALSGIRTSFIGKAMENAYGNARRESGKHNIPTIIILYHINPAYHYKAKVAMLKERPS